MDEKKREINIKKRVDFTCSCSGFFVPFEIARHAAELPLQLNPYCGTSGLHTFK